MSISDNTRLKVMEVEIKKLFQMFADSAEEQKAERARSMEM